MSSSSREGIDTDIVIFDIDGTLCNSFQLGFSSTNIILEKHGFSPVSEDDYHKGTKWTTPERLARHCGLDPVDNEQEFKSFGQKLGSEFDELYIGMVSTDCAPLYDGMFELLHDLAAVKRLGALTNAAVAYAERVLEVNKIRHLFSVVHGADDVRRPKPFPDGLQQCQEELLRNIPISNTDAPTISGRKRAVAVYIGDSPSDGVAARAAGMASVGVSWGSHSEESIRSSFDIVVPSVPLLRAVLFDY